MLPTADWAPVATKTKRPTNNPEPMPEREFKLVVNMNITTNGNPIY